MALRRARPDLRRVRGARRGPGGSLGGTRVIGGGAGRCPARGFGARGCGTHKPSAEVWRDLLARLRAHLEADLVLSGARPFARLKRHEDALDALICAWVGVQYLAGSIRAFGDEDAAIWTPET